jgi:hypothetical protein
MEGGHEMLNHLGSSLSFPTKEDARAHAPTLPHRTNLATVFGADIKEANQPPARVPPPRIPDHVIFEKLVQVLVFACAYERIADGTCSPITLPDRRDAWIELGVMDALRE